MKKVQSIEDLVLYESPAISEFVSNQYLQDTLARYLAWKINRKWERYQYRIKRKAYFNHL